MLKNKFTFIDLFAGVGGFHLALQDLGGECLFASEIHKPTRDAYAYYFDFENRSFGDIKVLTRPQVDLSVIPKHDVLAAGFPCQPFSKSGAQKGVLDTRGTLFDNILAILEEESVRPKFALLENVKNLLGPKHIDSTWLTIKAKLRELGYWVGENPTVFSPHLLSPQEGGAPQIRERVYIVAVFVGEEKARESTDDQFKVENSAVGAWNPADWKVYDSIVEADAPEALIQRLSPIRAGAWEAWQNFVNNVGDSGPKSRTLPGFPIWEFELNSKAIHGSNLPLWKRNFIEKNRELYFTKKSEIDDWRKHFDISSMPSSYRKFEWQAGTLKDTNDTVLQFRPSGLRVRPATYLPALVAINQQSYFPRVNRYISVAEAAKLQGLPREIFIGQADSLSFKQLGNSVSVSAVQYVFNKYLEHFEALGLI